MCPRRQASRACATGIPMSVVAADLDEDGWVDLYVASDSTAAIHYRNNQDGTFTDVAVARGTAFSENGMAQAGMGAAAGDIDADGRLDLVKTHFADDIPALFRALGNGRFEEVAMAAGLGSQNRYVEWGAGLVDFDNDGWQDLLYVTGNVYPEVERQMPDYPHKGPRIVFRNRGARVVRRRERDKRSGRDDAAVEPRRSVWRLRQRWRRGRARHEHERAPVAPAQRPHGRPQLAAGAARRDHVQSNRALARRCA